MRSTKEMPIAPPVGAGTSFAGTTRQLLLLLNVTTTAVLLGRNMTRKCRETSASATPEGYSHHLQDREKSLTTGKFK